MTHPPALPETAMHLELCPHWRRPWVISGIVLGVVYGILLRMMMSADKSFSGSLVMTISFLVLGPLLIGVIMIRELDAVAPTSVATWIFAPWLPAVLTCLVAILFRLEGFICVIFALPIAIVGASLGGVIAGLWFRLRRNAAKRATVACFAVLPMLLAPVEAHLKAPIETRTVASEIRIHASPETVWRNIERVPAISPTELRPNWTHRIGFPRPIEATLSYEGIGGVRHATFERGLLFIETVTAWEPEHRLAFTIRADTAHIPPTTLDEHVTIGGRYFDVLDGEYSIEPLANGDVLLHLASHQRLTTDFNGYAGLWSDAVMHTLQNSILEVIQHRCEHA